MATFNVIHKNQEMPARSLRGEEAGNIIYQTKLVRDQNYQPAQPLSKDGSEGQPCPKLTHVWV